ncbi:cellulose synthase-like D5 [Wolffia australiana]
MVVHPTSPSKVKIRVSTGGFGADRLTSPATRSTPTGHSPAGPRPRRFSAGGAATTTAEEPEETPGDAAAQYTVHIPPTPEHPLLSPSRTSFVSGTIFTGGFNSVTRGHVSAISAADAAAPPNPAACAMNGCDGTALLPCACGFPVCKDCYKDGGGAAGRCPGCKEPYKDGSSSDEDDGPVKLPDEDDDDDGGEYDEGRRRRRGVLPLASMSRRLSLMRSTKAPNQGNDMDYTRWLYETKGTYGYGNAVWPKTGVEPFDPPDFAAGSRRPLTRKIPVSAAIISPYRLLMGVRLAALGLFLAWRLRHPNREAMWLWGTSVTCELWFAGSWLLDQLPKVCPVNRVADLAVLRERFESPSPRNPQGRSDLPGVDVFVSTADPDKEPPLVTANTILSILAADYPVEKLACYVSDDGGSLLTFEAMAETASFAKLWVPFCRKHAVDPRSPEAYFSQKRDFLKNKLRVDFVRERRRVKREYDEFKVRVNSLPDAIRRRSEALNAREELLERARRRRDEPPPPQPGRTWMADGEPWPGTWFRPAPDHARGDHTGIIQVILPPPPPEPAEAGAAAETVDLAGVDRRLPMLVYVSREKRPGYDHNKKAGAMNALVRASAIMSNGPFVLNLDCDHYVHNSAALREGMCFMLDRGGDRVCFVQFPQRFDGVDPNDRYANHNTVFFDVSMRALDGLQGPMYVGTGCIFRRTALYGFSPPRATERAGWLGRTKTRTRPAGDEEDPLPPLLDGDDDDDDGGRRRRLLLPKRFGGSRALVESIPVAEFQGRLLQGTAGALRGRAAGSLAAPREPLDAAAVAEAIAAVSCFFEEKTEWGRRVGWIYGSVTEDVVTGYRMHNRGWRSVYCVTKRDAFRGTAPINLTDRLHQVLRWATGSVEIFFSRNNALFASRRMKLLQRVAYFNVGVYPFTSAFLLAYCVVPAASLFSGKFIVQALSATFLCFLLVITLTLCLLALLEIKWSGITLHDWWRNEQFWLIGGTSAHPAAVLQGLLKVVAGVDISFNLTSKPAAAGDDDDDALADLYAVKWSFLMVPPITIMMLNVVAIAVGVARAMYSPVPQWSKLMGGVLFSCWVLCHLYPFAKGLMGRRGRVPTVVFVWSALLATIVSLLWVYISPPAGSATFDSSISSSTGFHFP